MNGHFAITIFILNLIVNTHLIQSAVFENVVVILTTNQENEGCIDLRDPNWVAPTKKVFIISDDNISKYIKDETELRIVKITNRKIPKLKTNSIADLPNAEELQINSCGLKEIESGTFRNVPELKSIMLDNNELEIIKNDVFTGLEIISLSLENNKITTIEDRAFNNMRLKYIYLQHNQLSNWNSDWFNGSPLSTIFISHNLLEKIPKNAFKFLLKYNKTESSVGGSSDSTEIKLDFNLVDFSFNKIRKIENGAFNHIGAFEDLNLKNNQLETLQSGVFDGIKYLASLFLQDNKIAHVDEDIFEEDTKLTSIDLSNNELTNFPLKLLKTNVYYLLIDNNPVNCNWVEKVEEWMSNKTGDYLHENFSPAIPRLDKLKKQCV